MKKHKVINWSFFKQGFILFGVVKQPIDKTTDVYSFTILNIHCLIINTIK